MSNKIFLLVAFVFTGICMSYEGIGDRLLYNAFSHTALPLTVSDAISQGWAVYQTDDCNPSRGIEYAYDGGPSHSLPITLYFTSGGQISGFAVTAWGSYWPSTWGDYNFWESVGNDAWKISLSFRNSSVMCSGYFDSNVPIGDQLVLSQGDANFTAPLTPETAQKDLWTSGGCISSMGRHWGYDLQSAPVMSNLVETMVPIMPMYNNDAISAVLISINSTERVYPFGSWEGPFIPAAFCLNLCSDSCTFDTTFFSTMHFFFTDPSLNKCPDGRCPSSK